MEKLIKAATDRYNRKTIPGTLYARDFDTMIQEFDNRKLISLSRGLFHNNPLVKACIEMKASYAIGSAGEYRSTCKDSVAKDKFNAAIKQWSKIAEVSGMTFNDVQYLTSTTLDMDGDVAILLTETVNGYPQIQFIESGHAIGSRQNGKIDRGTMWEEKGVFYSKKNKRPLKYRIMAEKEADDTIVDAKNIVFIKEPSTSLRGIPLASSTIRALYDLQHSQELLLTQQEAIASTSIIIHNETGGNEIDLDDTSTSDQNVEVVNNEGGEIRYFKAGSGGKMEVIDNPNPSDQWLNYQNMLTNTAILALDWHRALLGMSTNTGVNDRLAIQQCSKAVEDRRVLLDPHWARICNYVISKLIKNGYLVIDNLPEDFYECIFTRCKSLTVDYARDGKQMIEEYRLGIKNMGEILGESGLDHDEHVLERYREEAKRQILKKQVEEEFGVTINELDARVISQNQYTVQDPTQQSQ